MTVRGDVASGEVDALLGLAASVVRVASAQRDQVGVRLDCRSILRPL